MGRVEENEKIINNFLTSLDNVGEAGMAVLTVTRPEMANSIINYGKTDILVDISRSLAVIADSAVEEETHSKSIALIEEKLMGNGITEKEWDIWVYLKEKYILGKKVESSDDTWNDIQDFNIPKGTNRICGFCNHSDFAYTDLDDAICHCALQSTDVSFTCNACEMFSDVRSNMTFEEFAKRWESYFDNDEMEELKKSWFKDL